ncbi:MAG: methyltransferase [Clostridiales bacterium]|nr:methyltransferase [Clostridiales bacterium]
MMERIDIVNEDIKLTQNLSGLTYGTDALLLSAFVRGRRQGRAVEFGAGTGIVSLLCAKRQKFSRIYAVEIQEKYASLCRRNVEANQFDQIIETVPADIREIDASLFGGPLDAVFSNPPYLKLGAGMTNENEEKAIARHELFGQVSDFCAAASRLLKHGGSFYVVYRPDRLDDLLTALGQHALAPKRLVMVYADAAHKACLVLVEAVKGGGAGIFVTKPLFIKTGDQDSEEMKWIYENGDFHEQYRKK